ncbi:MAG: DUF169 domain-containing protein [Candidatus Bathyarchaeia archaeon]|jgi:uncharacterized protein (DUF169 family)
MSRFGAEARKVVEILGLRWAPIAGRFSAVAEENGDSARRLSICEAFGVVKRENVVLNLSKENCTCPGGRHFTGLEVLPVETIASFVTKKGHSVYKSVDAAVGSIKRQPQPVNRGDFFILGPLEKFEKEPDIVFLLVNPAQAERILGLVSFRGAEPFTYYPASSICSTITNVMAKGKPEINLISAFERRGGRWAPNELMVGMPLKDFEAAIENIPESGYGMAETC